MGIKENLTKIKEQLGSNKVKIIAVTKYANQNQISEAFKLGIKDFGESYVQDAIKKIALKQQDVNPAGLINWHLIGRLQKNKVKFVVGNFSLIHSVDSLELAKVIDKTASQRNIIQEVLLQVNISQEAEKTGFSKSKLKDSYKDLLKLSNIKFQGLMTIAPKTDDKKIIRDCFWDLKNLMNEVNKEYRSDLKELSMGMSNDYLTAIECGSTMVRIGRAIFKNQ